MADVLRYFADQQAQCVGLPTPSVLPTSRLCLQDCVHEWSVDQGQWLGAWKHPDTVTMLIHVAGIFILHVTSAILLLIATIDNAWWFTDTMSTDLWGQWLKTNRGWTFNGIPETYDNEYLQVVQATSVLACLFCILGLFIYVAQLFTLSKGEKFTFSAIFQLISCLCIMIAASVYTNVFHKNKNGFYGHSFVLAWISFVLTLISSIIYFILRKKTN
ncbi:epithelial membrane protein 2-like [Arapaima gigas]